ncbi:MAG: hypothetical protein U5R31_00705 [Acidimicrobiia bacterium]|nr:hypothetical protein [Acidimicrobiia bacterium]
MQLFDRDGAADYVGALVDDCCHQDNTVISVLADTPDRGMTLAEVTDAKNARPELADGPAGAKDPTPCSTPWW